MARRIIAALDFGGTKLSAAILEAGNSQWLAQLRAFKVNPGSAEDDISDLLSLAHQALGGLHPIAVGVSFGGPVRAESGVVRVSHHVPGWENVDLATRIGSAFSAPVVVDNDANAGALGEYHYGAGRGKRSLLYITVSTGVGGGWVIGGQIWRGVDGMAGEIGHSVIDPDGPECLCGKLGCLERLASGPFMARDAAQLMQGGPRQAAILWDMCAGDPKRITGKMLSQAAANGDIVAAQVLERGAAALGVAIGNAANLMNPELIVMGGGVTQAGEAWWRTVRSTAAETVLPEVSIRIAPAELGDDSPLWGAAHLASEAINAQAIM